MPPLEAAYSKTEIRDGKIFVKKKPIVESVSSCAKESSSIETNWENS